MQRARQRAPWLPTVLAAGAVIAVVLTLAGCGGSGRAPRHGSSAATQTGQLTTRTAPSTSTAATTTTPTSTTTTSTTATGTTSTSTTPTTPGPAGGPVPAGFGPEGFTAIGELHWWLLGTAPCSSPPCTSIVRTSDGGATFVGIPAPRTDQVTALRFADALNGFAYGPELWATHDGGASWHKVAIPGQVADLEASAGYVFAIAHAAAGTGTLYRAPVGGGTWTPLTQAGNAYGGLWVGGGQVLLESTSASGSQQLLVSDDAGQDWVTHTPPQTLGCHIQATAPAIWAECATGMMSSVWRSTDGGATFSPVGSREVAGGGNGLQPQPNAAAFAAASGTTAVYGYQDLYRTTDAGATWSPVPTPSGVTWQYLGFTDATHGAALGYAGGQTAANARLYYTTDGGASYHLVAIGSG